MPQIDILIRPAKPLLSSFLTCGGLLGSSPLLGLPGEDEVVEEEGDEDRNRGEASGPPSSSNED
jgi:hypothetical protein